MIPVYNLEDDWENRKFTINLPFLKVVIYTKNEKDFEPMIQYLRQILIPT